jgi:hypothetical protein
MNYQKRRQNKNHGSILTNSAATEKSDDNATLLQRKYSA